MIPTEDHTLKSINRSDNPFLPLKGFASLVASTQLLIKEIKARGGSVQLIDQEFNLLNVQVENQEFLVLGTTYTETTSLLRHVLCEQKDLCKKLLTRKGFSTPKGIVVSTDTKVDWEQLKFPVVIKPTNANHGKDVYVAIINKEEAEEIIQRQFVSQYDKIIIEEYIQGREFRFLLIENELVGVIERVPANLVGDGKNNLYELAALKNEGRGLNYSFPLIQIRKSLIEDYLQQTRYDKNLIPQEGEKHYLTKVSNLSLGGDSIDRTDEISDHYKQIAAKITRAMELPIAGIDFIIPHLAKEEYYIIEINERPMISMHSFPYRGKNRKAEKYLLDHLMKRRR